MYVYSIGQYVNVRENQAKKKVSIVGGANLYQHTLPTKFATAVQ